MKLKRITKVSQVAHCISASLYDQRSFKAFEVAERVHEGQCRKYTGEEYIVHPVSVMKIFRDNFNGSPFDFVQATPNYLNDAGLMAGTIAALLHDTVEDTNLTLNDIGGLFGRPIASMVWWLSDFTPKEAGNRSMRKDMSAERIGRASHLVQEVKMCDIIDNVSDIREQDPDFAQLYIREKQFMLSLILEERRRKYLSTLPHMIETDIYQLCKRVIEGEV